MLRETKAFTEAGITEDIKETLRGSTNGAAAGKNIEIEKKYPLRDIDQYNAVVEKIFSLNNEGFNVSADEPRNRIWKYLDTPDQSFLNAGISFSVRDRGKDRFVTIKIPIDVDKRYEYEFSLGSKSLEEITPQDIVTHIVNTVSAENTEKDNISAAQAEELMQYFQEQQINLADLEFTVAWISSSHRIEVKNDRFPLGKVEVAVDNFTPIWSNKLGFIEEKKRQTIYEIEIEQKADKKKLKEITDESQKNKVKKQMLENGDKIRDEIIGQLPQGISAASEKEANKYKRAMAKLQQLTKNILIGKIQDVPFFEKYIDINKIVKISSSGNNIYVWTYSYYDRAEGYTQAHIKKIDLVSKKITSLVNSPVEWDGDIHGSADDAGFDMFKQIWKLISNNGSAQQINNLLNNYNNLNFRRSNGPNVSSMFSE